jgi:two-component system, OmpR family, response regulator
VIAESSLPDRSASAPSVRVLLLDDEPLNLILRAATLRQNGYECVPVATIEEAIEKFDQIDIAVIDYHLGAGQFGTEAASLLRRRRPHVPIIILSASVEHYFSGVEDLHLLKGYNSVEDLLSALKTLAAKRHGTASVIDARDFYYSRLAFAIGTDVIVQVFDENGTWLHCNPAAAGYFGHAQEWFIGRNAFEEMPDVMRAWSEVIANVALTRETYVDRTHRGIKADRLPGSPPQLWSVLAFPIALHDGRGGVVLTARALPPVTS